MAISGAEIGSKLKFKVWLVCGWVSEVLLGGGGPVPHPSGSDDPSRWFQDCLELFQPVSRLLSLYEDSFKIVCDFSTLFEILEGCFKIPETLPALFKTACYR